MRYLLAPLLILVLLSARAQPLEHTLLWRITPATGGATSYLYGTVHSKDERAFQFRDSVIPALQRCALVAGELDLGMGITGMQVMNAMQMPDGKRLPELYKKKQWKRVQAAISERLGPLSSMAERMKPFFVMAMLTEEAMEGDRPEVLDAHLLNLARANEQRVIGIETLAEQLTALDAMSLKEQAAMLLDHVDHDGYATELDVMLNAYASQDLEKLYEAAKQGGSMSPAMEKALLTDRNVRMVQRMDSIMIASGSTFFLIGAAHLPRPDGLIAGLRAKGHRVDPVIGPRSLAPAIIMEER